MLTPETPVERDAAKVAQTVAGCDPAIVAVVQRSLHLYGRVLYETTHHLYQARWACACLEDAVKDATEENGRLLP